MNTLTDTVEGYLGHLQTTRRVTDKSLKNYRSTCRAFASWAEETGRSLGSESIQDFVARYPHAATANVHLVRLVGLSKYAKLPVEVVRSKEDVREVEALCSDEVADLVKAAFVNSQEIGHCARFLAETGLRFDEFMRASVGDVKRSNSIRFLEVFGKGRKQRRVPLTAAAFESLKALPDRTPAFEKRLRAGLAQAGIDAGIDIHVHPHLLRASLISILLNERGKEAIHVAQLVGHSSVDTMLKHYAKVSMTALGGLLGN
jgi:site-specific recombinase XerD